MHRPILMTSPFGREFECLKIPLSRLVRIAYFGNTVKRVSEVLNQSGQSKVFTPDSLKWPPACSFWTDSIRRVHMASKGFVAITVERCKGCGFCVEFCPTRVLALSSAYNSKGYHPPHVVAGDKCSGCDLCGMYCPDFAIFGARHAR